MQAQRCHAGGQRRRRRWCAHLRDSMPRRSGPTTQSRAPTYTSGGSSAAPTSTGQSVGLEDSSTGNSNRCPARLYRSFSVMPCRGEM